MATRKVNPHARFYGLLSQMKGANKEDLVWKYSNMLTNSLAEFYERKPHDYQLMINDMQRTVNQMNDDGKAALIVERELKKRRSAVLLRLQKLGVDTTDWSVVNRFMRHPKIAGKTLGELDTDELDRLIPKLESILSKDREQLRGLTRESAFSRN